MILLVIDIHIQIYTNKAFILIRAQHFHFLLINNQNL